MTKIHILSQPFIWALLAGIALSTIGPTFAMNEPTRDEQSQFPTNQIFTGLLLAYEKKIDWRVANPLFNYPIEYGKIEHTNSFKTPAYWKLVFLNKIPKGGYLHKIDKEVLTRYKAKQDTFVLTLMACRYQIDWYPDLVGHFPITDEAIELAKKTYLEKIKQPQKTSIDQ